MKENLKLYEVGVIGHPDATELIAAYSRDEAIKAHDWNELTAGSDYREEDMFIDYIGEIKPNAIVR